METMPNVHAMSGANGGADNASAEVPSTGSTPGKRKRGARRTDIHEDWLSMATADPALWLRDIDV